MEASIHLKFVPRKHHGQGQETVENDAVCSWAGGRRALTELTSWGPVQLEEVGTNRTGVKKVLRTRSRVHEPQPSFHSVW